MPATLTADQFRLWVDRPENATKRRELVRGVPTEMQTWPTAFHAIHMHVAAMLGDYVIGRGHGSVAFLGDGLITARDPDTVRCPAVMLFLNASPVDDFPLRFTTEVPQLVVEIATPDESYGRYMRRIVDYMHSGIPLIWALEPDDRSLTVWMAQNPPKVLDETDELTGNGVLPEFACRVGDFFALPGQQPPLPPTS